MIIIPSILTNSPQEAKQLINIYEELVDRVQVDIIDGKFANNKTIDPSVLNHIDTNLLLDFHLMVESPLSWIEKCFQAGADRVIGHIEHMSDQFEFVNKCQELGIKTGLAIDLDTDLVQIQPNLLTDLDVILLMSVLAGFGGQTFHENIYLKLEELVNLKNKNNAKFNICIDGGVNFDSAKRLAELGADEVSVGRSLIKGNVESNIEHYKAI